MTVRIEPLGPHHDRGAFCCGNDIIDAFCRDALTDHNAFRQRVHVAVEEGTARVLGYYCLRIIVVGPKKYAQPEIELAMIGVDRTVQNQGIGTALLTHAFERAYEVAKAVGITQVWLDATNVNSARLYERLGFERVEEGSLKMFIPVRVIADALDAPAT